MFIDIFIGASEKTVVAENLAAKKNVIQKECAKKRLSPAFTLRDTGGNDTVTTFHISAPEFLANSFY